MKSKKGFIMSTYVYVILVFFLLLLGTLLIVMNNTKLISNFLRQELITQNTNESHITSDYFNTKLNGGYNNEGLILTNGNELRYRGSNPKNYVMFNNELWRIIGIFDGNVKLIRNSALGTYSWDTSASNVNSGNGINEWSKSDLMKELNEDYLNTDLFGNISWYDGNNNQQNGVYVSNYGLNNSSQELIIDAVWYLGGSTDNVSLEKQYKNERGTKHVSGPSDGVSRTNTWLGKVGLIYPSDYVYASTSSTCYKNIQNEECSKGNWLDKNTSNYWTITPYYSSANEAQVVSNSGNINHIKTSNTSSEKADVFPVVYLADDVLVSGEGTQDNPYQFTRNKTNAIEYLIKKYNNGSNDDGLILVNNNEVRYSGLDVNNYVNFNNETWRIIGVVDGRIKLMRDEVIGSAKWDSDTSSGNAWIGSAVEIGLNGNYLTSTGYLGSSLSSDAQNLIDNADWYTTAITNSQNTSSAYNAEHTGSTISRKVGLIYPSDYGYASSACYNDSTKKLWDSTQANSYHSDTCKNSNWMYTNMSSTIWWTIVSTTRSSNNGLYVHSNGAVGDLNAYDSRGVRPVVYLKSDVKISGDGTKANPFIFTSAIEEEYTYNKVGQDEFTAPATGYYKVELWGAQGGGAYGGLGAYTSGVIKLNKNDKIYVYIGGNGEDVNSNTTGGYNGGGNSTAINGKSGTTGGGATDIRYFANAPTAEQLLWNSELGLNSRIMVAGGGGGGERSEYQGDGGFIGLDAHDNSYTYYSYIGKGGSQTFGGIAPTKYKTATSNGTAGSFGIGGTGGASASTASTGGGAGGGGGYYGGSGASGLSNGVFGGGGGSSFISGYAGVNAIRTSNNRNHINNTRHYSTKYFIDGKIETGVNSGDGRAKITYIGTTYEKANSKLDNVRYIKDCINGNSVNSWNHWVEIQAIKSGLNLARDKNVTGTSPERNNSTKSYSYIVDGIIDNVSGNKGFGSSTDTGYQCVTVDLSQSYDLDEIAVWHYYPDNRTYNENITYVSSDNEEWVEVINKEEPETPNGKRINAYVVD